MKAIQCQEWGGPDKLRLVELPLPEPKAGEVRLRVNAAGVNFPDALIIQKKYQQQQLQSDGGPHALMDH